MASSGHEQRLAAALTEPRIRVADRAAFATGGKRFRHRRTAGLAEPGVEVVLSVALRAGLVCRRHDRSNTSLCIHGGCGWRICIPSDGSRDKARLKIALDLRPVRSRAIQLAHEADRPRPQPIAHLGVVSGSDLAHGVVEVQFLEAAQREGLVAFERRPSPTTNHHHVGFGFSAHQGAEPSGTRHRPDTPPPRP